MCPSPGVPLPSTPLRVRPWASGMGRGCPSSGNNEQSDQRSYSYNKQRTPLYNCQPRVHSHSSGMLRLTAVMSHRSLVAAGMSSVLVGRTTCRVRRKLVLGGGRIHIRVPPCGRCRRSAPNHPALPRGCLSLSRRCVLGRRLASYSLRRSREWRVRSPRCWPLCLHPPAVGFRP